MDAITFETYLSKFPARSYKKRWPIINAGDELGKIFYLKKGFVRLFSISPEGKELTFIIYQPGEFFPLIAALLPPLPYRYWVETMTPSKIIAIPRSSFIAFFIKNPDLLLDLAVEIMKRLDRMLRRMEYLAFANAYQKVASIFAILAERFGDRKGKVLSSECHLCTEISLPWWVSREKPQVLKSKNLRRRELSPIGKGSLP